VALGHHAVKVGHRIRYFTATDLIETLYRALADNSVGKVITGILKSDLILIGEIRFAPMDGTGAELFFRIVAAYERQSLGWPCTGPSRSGGRSSPNKPRPSLSWTACSITG